MDQQHTSGTPAPKPQWRGEYDRIYRLMVATKLRPPTATPRTAKDAAVSPERVP